MAFRAKAVNGYKTEYEQMNDNNLNRELDRLSKKIGNGMPKKIDGCKNGSAQSRI